ncbi:MAG: metallophosphoesterase [Ignavibacteriaceae bacterium]
MKKVILIILTFVSILTGQDFKFAFMSDSRGRFNGVNDPVLSKLANDLVTRHPDAKFLIFAGDMVDGNKNVPERTMSDLEHWKKVMEPVYKSNMIFPKIWVTVGNHEIQHRDDEKNFGKAFPNTFMNGPEDEKGTTYYFDHDKCRFVILNTNRWYYGDPNDTTDDRRDWHYFKDLNWLERVLKEGRESGEINHIFVIGHDMFFPTGGHLRDGLPFIGMDYKGGELDSTRKWFLNQSESMWKLLVKYDVAAYFAGHEHLYSRQSVDGIYQIVAGSAGAPIYFHNSKYGDNPEKKRPGQEMTYDEALPYYKLLGYNFGPEGNAQKSDDFVGLRAFHYSVLEVEEHKVTVKTYGMPVKEGTQSEPESFEIQLLDEFIMEKGD